MKNYKIINFIPGIEDTPASNTYISIDLSKYITNHQLTIDNNLILDKMINLDNVYLMNKHFTIDNDPILSNKNYNLASFQNINLLNQLIGLLNNTIHITSANLIDLIEQTSGLIIDQIEENIDDITLSDPIFTANSGIFTTKEELTVTSTLLSTAIDNISGFSGNYEDLLNKPTIPSKTSQLENDSGFISDIDIDIDNIFPDYSNRILKNFNIEYEAEVNGYLLCIYIYKNFTNKKIPQITINNVVVNANPFGYTTNHYDLSFTYLYPIKKGSEYIVSVNIIDDSTDKVYFIPINSAF